MVAWMLDSLIELGTKNNMIYIQFHGVIENNVMRVSVRAFDFTF